MDYLNVGNIILKFHRLLLEKLNYQQSVSKDILFLGFFKILYRIKNNIKFLILQME